VCGSRTWWFQNLVFCHKKFRYIATGWGVQVFRIFNWKLMDGWLERRDKMWFVWISIRGCQPTGAVEAVTMKKKWKSKSTWRKFGNSLPVRMSSSSNQLGIDCAWRKSVSGATCTLNWMINDWIWTGYKSVAVESNRQIALSFRSKLPWASTALEIIFKCHREVSCPSWIVGSWRYDWLFFFFNGKKAAKSTTLPFDLFDFQRFQGIGNA